MTNENCLKNIYCPACGQDDHFYIDARSTFLVTDDGAEDAGDVEWDDTSYCRCFECDQTGPLKEFTAPDDLPPDPEGKNHRRAAWAGKAVAAFREATGTEAEDALGDLLCDLHHWADRHNYDFYAAYLRSMFHYDAETAGEAV